MPESYGVEVHHLESAAELLDRLQDRAFWGNDEFPMHEYVYRGLPDSEMGLLPTAFRKSSWISFRHLLGNHDYSLDDEKQRTHEIEIVRQFVSRCDREGFQVPNVETWLNVDAEEESKRSGAFPRDDLRAGISLARHHGVPSRFLDWTESALVAAYFAAVGALKKGSRSGKLAVWALNVGRVTSLSGTEALPEEHIRMVRLPWSSNANLRAQRGVFTLRVVDELNLRHEHEPLEATVSRLVGGKASHHPLKKLTLPQGKAVPLLYKLRLEGVDVATAFPSYESVTASLKEQRHSGLGVLGYTDGSVDE